MSALRFARVVVPSLCLALVPLASSSDARAAGLEDDSEVFAQDAPDAGGPATRRAEDRRHANDRDWFRAPVQVGPEDFPSAEVHDAVVANTRAATARAVYRRVESEMHRVVRAAVREFEQSAELKEAVAAEQRAYDALLDARRQALRDVLDNPKYQAMQELRQTLTQRIADRRDAATVTISGPRPVSIIRVSDPPASAGDDVVAIATVKLRVGTDASVMERDALADNEKVRQAKADLADASAKVTALRAGFDQSLRQNEDLRRVRDDLEEARIARVTAETYFLGADRASTAALDFSYYLHRWDYYRYNHYDYGYGYYPYRFGYPSYYYGGNGMH